MGWLQDGIEEFRKLPPAGKLAVGGVAVGVVVLAIAQARSSANSATTTANANPAAGLIGSGGGFTGISSGIPGFSYGSGGSGAINAWLANQAHTPVPSRPPYTVGGRASAGGPIPIDSGFTGGWRVINGGSGGSTGSTGTPIPIDTGYTGWRTYAPTLTRITP